MKHVLSTTWLANWSQGHSHFRHNFQRSYEYLIHYHQQWRFLCSLNGHILPPSTPPPPQLCWLLSLQWLSYLEHCDPISFKHVSFTPNQIPLTYRCPIKRTNRFRRTSTLSSHCWCLSLDLSKASSNFPTFAWRRRMSPQWNHSLGYQCRKNNSRKQIHRDSKYIELKWLNGLADTKMWINLASW